MEETGGAGGVRSGGEGALHGAKGESALVKELVRITGRPDISDAAVFMGENFVPRLNEISDLRGRCASAGAKIFPVQERHLHHAGLGPWQAERGD